MRLLNKSTSKLSFLLFLSAFLIVQEIKSQELITIRKSLNYAEKNSSTIGRDLLELKRNQFLESHQTNALIPTLSFSSNLGGLSGRFIDPAINSFITKQTVFQTYSFQSNIVLLSNTSFKLLTMAARHTSSISKYKLENDRLNLKANVLESYLSLVNANTQLQIIKKSLDFYQKQILMIDTLILHGRRSRLDKLRFEQQMSADSIQLIQRQGQFNANTLELKVLLNMNSPITFLLEDSTIADEFKLFSYIQQLTITDLEDAFFQDHPLVGQDRAALDLRHAQARIAKRSWVPTIGLGVGVGSNYSNNYFLSGKEVNYFVQLLQNNLSHSVFLNLNIPIFNHSSVKKAVYQANIGVEDQIIANQANLNQLKKAITSTFNDANNTYKSYLQSKSSLKKSEELVEATAELYLGNKITSLDYLSSWKEFVERSLIHADMKTSAILKILILRLYANKSIDWLK